MGEDRQVDHVLNYYDTVIRTGARVAQYDKNRSRGLRGQRVDAGQTALGGAAQTLQQKYRKHLEKQDDLRRLHADPDFAELRSDLKKAKSYGRRIKKSIAGVAKSTKGSMKAHRQVVRNSTGPHLLGSHKALEGLAGIASHNADGRQYRLSEEQAREAIRATLAKATGKRDELRQTYPNAPLRRESRAINGLDKAL